MIAQPQPETTFSVTNPATGQHLETLPVMDRAAVEAAVQRARDAAKFWSALPVTERCARLFAVGKVMTRRLDELVEVVSRENGKVEMEALSLDVGPTLVVLNYFLQNGPRILADQPINVAATPHRKSYLSFQSKGVVGVISPWNFPFFIPACDTLMALIAGNGVVIKPSEVTPMSSLALKSCIDEAGIDPDLVQVVTGLGETGAALIDSRPDHVVFTGSVPTGRKIGVACAERMIPYTLELGGKAPAIVLEDANLERTTQAILWGGFANCGQICASVERVYAMPQVYEQLVSGLTARASQLRVGRPSDPVDMGSMTWARQREITERLIADARDRGARITTGGAAVDGPGLFHRPTVIADCTADMEIMKAECFGPVVPLMKVESEAQALALANDSELGLGAYVFTGDGTRGRRLAEQLEVGSVMVNDVLSHAGMPETPWGGIKSSGLGFVRSDRGLQDLCHARHVSYDRIGGWARDPIWFPYRSEDQARLRGFFKQIFGGRPWSRVIRKLLS